MSDQRFDTIRNVIKNFAYDEMDGLAEDAGVAMSGMDQAELALVALDSLEAELAQVRENACPTDPIYACPRETEANHRRVQELQEAVEGEAYARPESPSEVWRELLAKVAQVREERDAAREMLVSNALWVETRAELVRYREALERIAAQDWRGNEPIEIAIARAALTEETTDA